MTDKGDLISSRWKNTADVYSVPEPRIQGGRVPSLVWFCLQCISEFPDQIHLHCKLTYRPATHRSPKSFRLVDKLLRRHENGDPDKDQQPDLSRLDPRLWAVMIQIFDHIPSELRTYTIPLNDELLPLLQWIPNTATFSLMTVLELPGCPALTDDSITELKILHTLAAFDASHTGISARGISSLARTLRANDPTEVTRRLRGLWALRILRVKHCAKIDDAIYSSLSVFPLLSVVDLRGTKCRPRVTADALTFSPNKKRSLFSSDLALSLEALQQYEEGVQMHSAPKAYQFTLRIKTLCHDAIANTLTEAENHVQSHPSPSLGQASRKRPWGEEHQGIHVYGDTRGEDFDLSSDDHEVYRSYQSRLECDTEAHEGDKAKRDEEGHDEELQEHGGKSLFEGQGREHFRGEGDDYTVIRSHYQDEFAPEALLLPESRPSKRPKTSTTNETQVHSPRIMSSRHFDNSDSSSEDGRNNHPIVRLPLCSRDRWKLHWYDADRARDNTYVPISLVKRKHDNELMLYRPMRSWPWLENELDRLMAKEAHWKEARDKKNAFVPALIAPDRRKGLEVQAALKSMTAAVLHHRQMDSSRAKNEHLRRSSKNPFARKSTAESFSVMQNTSPPPRPPIQAPLKPISTLQIPEFTQALLQQSAREGCTTRDSMAKEPCMSQNTKNSPVTAKLSAWAPFDFPSETSPESTRFTSTDLGEEHPKRRCIRVSDPMIPIASSSTMTNSVQGEDARRKKGGKTQQREFDWTAWAS